MLSNSASDSVDTGMDHRLRQLAKLRREANAASDAYHEALHNTVRYMHLVRRPGNGREKTGIMKIKTPTVRRQLSASSLAADPCSLVTPAP